MRRGRVIGRLCRQSNDFHDGSVMRPSRFGVRHRRQIAGALTEVSTTIDLTATDAAKLEGAVMCRLHFVLVKLANQGCDQRRWPPIHPCIRAEGGGESRCPVTGAWRQSESQATKRSAVTQTFPISGLRVRFRAHTLHLAGHPLQETAVPGGRILTCGGCVVTRFAHFAVGSV